MISFSSSVNMTELLTSKRRVTLLFVLFTFCPPGPLLRDVWKLISLPRSCTVILRCMDPIQLFKYTRLQDGVVQLINSLYTIRKNPHDLSCVVFDLQENYLSL